MEARSYLTLLDPNELDKRSSLFEENEDTEREILTIHLPSGKKPPKHIQRIRRECYLNKTINSPVSSPVPDRKKWLCADFDEVRPDSPIFRPIVPERPLEHKPTPTKESILEMLHKFSNESTSGVGRPGTPLPTGMSRSQKDKDPKLFPSLACLSSDAVLMDSSRHSNEKGVVLPPIVRRNVQTTRRKTCDFLPNVRNALPPEHRTSRQLLLSPLSSPNTDSCELRTESPVHRAVPRSPYTPDESPRGLQLLSKALFNNYFLSPPRTAV